MFEISNLSNNPLQLSDGKSIAPGETRKIKNVSDRDRNYADRGWLSIVEEVKPKATEPEVKK